MLNQKTQQGSSKTILNFTEVKKLRHKPRIRFHFRNIKSIK